MTFAGAAELPGVTIQIERSERAQSCPTEQDVVEELHVRMGPTRRPRERISIHVELDAEGEMFTAHIAARGARQGERALNAAGPSCVGLRDALIVALLVLLDENPDVRPKPLVTARAVTRERSETPVRSSRRTSGWLSVGSGLTHGLPFGWSLATQADLALRVGAAEVSLGGFWAPERAIDYAPGQVLVNVIGGRLRGCYAPFVPSKRLRLGGCALVVAARLSGSGRGYTTRDSSLRPWWMLGVAPELRWFPSARVALGVSASALVPLNHESFSIAGLGVAYESDALVGFLGADLGVQIW